MTETKRVRILVVIDPDGRWEAVGSFDFDDDTARSNLDDYADMLREHLRCYHWIEANVPVPVELPEGVIEGEVQP